MCGLNVWFNKESVKYRRPIRTSHRTPVCLPKLPHLLLKLLKLLLCDPHILYVEMDDLDLPSERMTTYLTELNDASYS